MINFTIIVNIDSIIWNKNFHKNQTNITVILWKSSKIYYIIIKIEHYQASWIQHKNPYFQVYFIQQQ